MFTFTPSLDVAHERGSELLNSLYVTYCSKEKNPVASGSPEQIYSAPRISKFINMCKSKGLNWAIFSAKYGLFFSDEIHDNYNLTFKTVACKCMIKEDGRMLSREESARKVKTLIEKLRNQISERRIKSITFFVNKPLLRKKCYLSILHTAVDECDIHKKWHEIVRHINSLFKDRRGRIRLITSLDEIW